MHIDFAIIDTSLSENEIKDLTKKISGSQCINTITAPPYIVKIIKNIIDTNIIGVSYLIDFPLGISDSKTRKFSVEQAIKSGCNQIDISMPQNLASNRRYDKIREDVKLLSDICLNNNILLNYILEYRVFDHYCLKKICEIFDENNHIERVYPSTGFFIDNLADNILASLFLYQNSKNLKILSSGNMWTNKHFETIVKSGLFGIRTFSVHTLNNFVKYNTHKQS